MVFNPAWADAIGSIGRRAPFEFNDALGEFANDEGLKQKGDRRVRLNPENLSRLINRITDRRWLWLGGLSQEL